MSRLSIGYDIGRCTGQCVFTGEALAPGTPCVAALCENSQQPGFLRVDSSISAWEAGQRPPGLFSYWRTIAPEPNSKPRLLVDDQVLLEIFLRLGDDARADRQAFRFVLALILLRRRVLRSVGRQQVPMARAGSAGRSEGGAGDGELREVWLLKPRGAEEGAPPLRVVDPRLGEADLAAIAEQLGEVLEGGS